MKRFKNWCLASSALVALALVTAMTSDAEAGRRHHRRGGCGGCAPVSACGGCSTGYSAGGCSTGGCTTGGCEVPAMMPSSGGSPSDMQAPAPAPSAAPPAPSAKAAPQAAPQIVYTAAPRNTYVTRPMGRRVFYRW